MLTHILWFLALVIVAALVAQFAADRERVHAAIAKVRSDSRVEVLGEQVASATAERDHWKAQASGWHALYEQENAKYRDFFDRTVTLMQATSLRAVSDDLIEDPPTVTEADEEEMEVRRQAIERVLMREREPVPVDDEEAPPVARLTDEDGV